MTNILSTILLTSTITTNWISIYPEGNILPAQIECGRLATNYFAKGNGIEFPPVIHYSEWCFVRRTTNENLRTQWRHIMFDTNTFKTNNIEFILVQ